MGSTIGKALLVCCVALSLSLNKFDCSQAATKPRAENTDPILELDGRIHKLSISPNEKIGAVVLGPNKYRSKATEPRKIVVFDLATHKVLAEREFELGLVDCAMFDDRVYAVSNPSNQVIQLDPIDLKTKGRIQFDQPIEEIVACGNTNLVLVGKSRLTLFKRGEVRPIANVIRTSLRAERRGSQPPNPTLVESHDGMVRLGGAWFDLESGKLVGLSSRLSFYDFKQRTPQSGRWTWDIPRSISYLRKLKISTSPNGVVSSWRFPCLFNVEDDSVTIDTIRLKLNMIHIFSGKKIASKEIGTAKCLVNLDSRWQIKWSLELGKAHAYVAKERSVFKVALPLRQLEQTPSFPIRQPFMSVEYGKVASFSVAMSNKDSSWNIDKGYVLKSLTPGIQLDKDNGKVVVDSSLVWKSYHRVVSNSESDFTPEKIAEYQRAYQDLTGETTEDVPMLIRIPVTLRLRDVIVSTAYCLLLMIPQNELLAQFNTKEDKPSARTIEREKQKVKSALENKLRTVQNQHALLLKKIDSKMESTERKIKDVAQKIQKLTEGFGTIESQSESTFEELVGLEQAQQNLEKQASVLNSNFGEIESQLKVLRSENESLQTSALLTGLIGVGGAGAVFIAGIICFFVVLARKIQI